MRGRGCQWKLMRSMLTLGRSLCMPRRRGQCTSHSSPRTATVFSGFPVPSH
jgi:hypothetical protein